MEPDSKLTQQDRTILKYNELRLPLRIQEACILHASLTNYLRTMKQGEERRVMQMIFEKLDSMYLDLQSYYDNLPF